jgi:hypothetical protein
MSKGFIAMFREALITLFHFSDAESISLAESNKMSAIVASNPPSAKPTSDVSEMALAAALDTTVVLEITVVVSIFLMSPQLQ